MNRAVLLSLGRGVRGRVVSVGRSVLGCFELSFQKKFFPCLMGKYPGLWFTPIYIFRRRGETFLK